MPVIKLTSAEASRVKRKRAKDKARNEVLYAVVDKIKCRLKTADALEAATITAILHDVRSMVR